MILHDLPQICGLARFLSDLIKGCTPCGSYENGRDHAPQVCYTVLLGSAEPKGIALYGLLYCHSTPTMHFCGYLRELTLGLKGDAV